MLLLIKYRIIILKEVQPQNPNLHCWMRHDAQLNEMSRFDDVVFLWDEVGLFVDGEHQVWEVVHIVIVEGPTCYDDLLTADEAEGTSDVIEELLSFVMGHEQERGAAVDDDRCGIADGKLLVWS